MTEEDDILCYSLFDDDDEEEDQEGQVNQFSSIRNFQGDSTFASLENDIESCISLSSLTNLDRSSICKSSTQNMDDKMVDTTIPTASVNCATNSQETAAGENWSFLHGFEGSLLKSTVETDFSFIDSLFLPSSLNDPIALSNPENVNNNSNDDDDDYAMILDGYSGKESSTLKSSFFSSINNVSNSFLSQSSHNLLSSQDDCALSISSMEHPVVGHLNAAINENRFHQLLLESEIEYLDALIRKNHALQSRFRSVSQSDFDPLKKSYNFVSYFATENIPAPFPRNPDMNALEQRERLVKAMVKFPRWTKEEREALALAIQCQNQKLFLTKEIARIRDRYINLQKANLAYSTMSKSTSTTSLENDPVVQKQIWNAMRKIESLPATALQHNVVGIDWEKVVRQHVPHRTVQECIAKWTLSQHPAINQSEWTESEKKTLLVIVDKMMKGGGVAGGAESNRNGESGVVSEASLSSSTTANMDSSTKAKRIDWVKVANTLGTSRTAYDCITQYRRHCCQQQKSIRKMWTQEEDQILLRAVELYGNNWIDVASCLNDRSSQQCINRYLKTVDPNIKRGRWTKSEDDLLVKAVGIYGTKNWRHIQAFVPGRTDVQCRERYLGCLDPSYNRSKWTSSEDELLKEAILKFGVGKWSSIASFMKTRKDHQCMRRYRQLQENDKKASDDDESKSTYSRKKRKRRAAVKNIELERKLLVELVIPSHTSK